MPCALCSWCTCMLLRACHPIQNLRPQVRLVMMHADRSPHDAMLHHCLLQCRRNTWTNCCCTRCKQPLVEWICGAMVLICCNHRGLARVCGCMHAYALRQQTLQPSAASLPGTCAHCRHVQLFLLRRCHRAAGTAARIASRGSRSS